MVSGLVSFETIVESVKDETGLENLRSYYERIKRLMFRAERQIGYGGSVILKKVVYVKGEHGFDGLYLKFPPDYIEHEGIGNKNGIFHGSTYDFRPEGIRIKKSTDKVVLLYYGVFCDGQGNPVTTRNHEEAVINFIVWKLYTSKIFLGIGNMNANKNYQYEFENALMASRGNDAWPTTEQMTALGHMTYQWIGSMIMYPTAGYTYDDDSIQTYCPPVTAADVLSAKVYYWQESSMATTITDVIDEFNASPETYFDNKNYEFLSVFQQGKIVNYADVGKICFAIQETENLNWQFIDALNNDITDLFELHYNAATKTIIFVSIENYTYSSMYFKFKELFSSVLPGQSGNSTFDNTFDNTFN